MTALPYYIDDPHIDEACKAHCPHIEPHPVEPATANGTEDRCPASSISAASRPPWRLTNCC